MIWYILIALSVIGVLTGIVWYRLDEDSAGGISTIVISAIVLLVLTLCVPLAAITNDKAMATFKQQKNYIEQQDDSNIENIALTTKKIELNQWLYSAQYGYTNYKLFTLYNKEIMELKEIE